MSIQNCSDNIRKASEFVKEADYIIIGAGSGLSASGGLNYGDSKLFKKWFPELFSMGLETIGDACSTYWNVNDSNRRAFWAYWANHIKKIRYDAPAGRAYLDLFDILKDRNYFIITTNVDSQFNKAGFNKDKMFTPQGNYGFFQCGKPCCDEVFNNEVMVNKMISNMDYDSFLVRNEDIPRCPKCGSYLAKNLRVDETFVEIPHMKKQKYYIDFINNSIDGKLVLLEIGVGFNTPSIIRWPFERIVSTHPNAKIIRMNMSNPEVPKEISDKSLSFNDDITEVISHLKKYFIREKLKNHNYKI
jgi:NAD-dependent SIR2 family protein deacetylase